MFGHKPDCARIDGKNTKCAMLVTWTEEDTNCPDVMEHVSVQVESPKHMHVLANRKSFEAMCKRWVSDDYRVQ